MTGVFKSPSIANTIPGITTYHWGGGGRRLCHPIPKLQNRHYFISVLSKPLEENIRYQSLYTHAHGIFLVCTRMGEARVLSSPLTPSDRILVKRAYHLAGCENEDETYGGEVDSKHLKRPCLKWGENESESVEMGVNRGESGFLCNGFSPLTELGVCKRPGMKRQR